MSQSKIAAEQHPCCRQKLRSCTGRKRPDLPPRPIMQAVASAPDASRQGNIPGRISLHGNPDRSLRIPGINAGPGEFRDHGRQRDRAYRMPVIRPMHNRSNCCRRPAVACRQWGNSVIQGPVRPAAIPADRRCGCLCESRSQEQACRRWRRFRSAGGASRSSPSREGCC